MYFNSLLHFPKNSATNVVLKEGDGLEKDPEIMPCGEELAELTA